MTKRAQSSQTTAVLSVESDVVRFTVFSVDDGHVLLTSATSLPLIQVAPGPVRGECIKVRGAATDEGPMGAGHVEQDPRAIWDAVKTVIGEVMDSVQCGCGTPAGTRIRSLTVTNEMSTLVAWHAVTGVPLHNAVHWMDTRMGGRGCTAAAAEWLLRRSAAVAGAKSACRMGTLDAWLLWKLTAGRAYVTDVTNASYTGLLDLDTLLWDRDAVRACGLPEHAWPAVRWPVTSAVATVLVGRLRGLPIMATVARPSATLYAQSCNIHGHVVVTLTCDAAVVLGQYGWPLQSKDRNGLLDSLTPVVGYWTTEQFQSTTTVTTSRPRVVYAVLALSTAPQVIGWLRDNVSLVKSVDECMNVHSSATPTGGGYRLPSVVPPEAAAATFDEGPTGLLVCGLTESMGRDHLIVAAVDSVCYTVAVMVWCVMHATFACLAGNCKCVATVYVDGEYGHRYDNLLAQLADMCDCQVVRRRADMATVGAAEMAGCIASNTGTEDSLDEASFSPRRLTSDREFSFGQWSKAVTRNLHWSGADASELHGQIVAMEKPLYLAYLSCLVHRIRHVWSALVAKLF